MKNAMRSYQADQFASSHGKHDAVVSGRPVRGMSGSGHAGKARETIVAVMNLVKSGKLSVHDQVVAVQIVRELSDALKTQRR
jgi:hypothetical protein